MSWFKVDDSFYDHPKVFDAPDCATALWIRAGCWSARNLKDGFVPTNMPARLCDDPDRAIRELIDRGLWKRTRGGYQFHDWSDYQPTREEVEASREKIASGAALGNHRRWHVNKGLREADCRFCQEEQLSGSDRPPDRPPDGYPESPPNPPDPSRPQEPKTLAAPDGFDDFWAAYPTRRNSSKLYASRAYAKAIKEGASGAEILAAAKVYAADQRGKDQTFTAHAATWLNGKRWETLHITVPEIHKTLWDN